MKIKRLSESSMENILDGKISEDATCLIKFYSNNCHFCHKLKDVYEEVSDDFPDVYFFAFNVADNPKIKKRLNFTGVPTIYLINTRGADPNIKIMPEPSQPDRTTWYTAESIKNFITKERQ